MALASVRNPWNLALLKFVKFVVIVVGGMIVHHLTGRRVLVTVLAQLWHQIIDLKLEVVRRLVQIIYVRCLINSHAVICTQMMHLYGFAMSDALRDEDSGICFRDSYGFCSTGSQISWIPPNSSKNSSDLCDATHFFTAASDPLVASYKRFVFKNAEEGGGGMTNYGTLELWHRWREIALQGGLKRCYSRDDKDKIKKVMQEAEVQAFSAITSGSDIHQIDLSFKSAVEQELALLGTKKP
mmetsp:Transcript_50230/g.75635  ORF Transcript_50230/g.75635 Transcript_50230/m.75635 type:complete len:240 (-) Transcript_50230:159-878(-)